MTQRDDTMDLSGKVALVSGSSAGLGHEIAIALGRAGASVALNYCHDTARAQGAMRRFDETGAQGALFRADVTDAEAVASLVRDIGERLGPIDILVVNATPSQPMRPLEDYTWEEVQRMLDAFVKSPFLLSQAVVPSMKDKGSGRIIQIGSEVFEQGTPNFSAYVAAKGGQAGLNRSLATELAPFGITVNMVSPGWIPVARHADATEADKAAYVAETPMGHFGAPRDVASAVCYLASDAARFVTGANLHVNGGRSLG